MEHPPTPSPTYNAHVHPHSPIHTHTPHPKAADSSWSGPWSGCKSTGGYLCCHWVNVIELAVNEYQVLLRGWTKLGLHGWAKSTIWIRWKMWKYLTTKGSSWHPKQTIFKSLYCRPGVKIFVFVATAVKLWTWWGLSSNFSKKWKVIFWIEYSIYVLMKCTLVY